MSGGDSSVPFLRGIVLSCLLASSSVMFGTPGQRAIATQPPSPVADALSPHPDMTPIDPNLLRVRDQRESRVMASTISMTSLTVPSLWWMKEQFAAQEKNIGDRLIETWAAYPASDGRPGRVDMVVNRQLWSMMKYLQRYAFINDFGSAARDFGFNIRVFDSRATMLAAYTCNFKPAIVQVGQLSLLPSSQAKSTMPLFSDYVQPPHALACNTMLDYSGKSGLRGSSTSPLGGGTSTVTDTVPR